MKKKQDEETRKIQSKRFDVLELNEQQVAYKI
jgi:hypothetical protein